MNESELVDRIADTFREYAMVDMIQTIRNGVI